MSSAALVLTSVLLSPAAVPAKPGDPSSVADVEALEEVVVTGRIPGPPLWKVSRGDHVLWILPLVDAYPRNIEWQSARVEALVAQSQEFIERPVANWGISTLNPLTMARMLRAGKRYSRLAESQTLADVLPAGLYRRYQGLQARHFPRESRMETLRISVAGMEMQREIMDQEDLEMLSYRSLASPKPITEKLRRWLKQNSTIRRTSPAFRKTRGVGFRDMGALSKAIEEASSTETFIAWELTCFEQVLTYFEDDISRVKRRANDWARGRAGELVDPSPLRGLGDACHFPPLVPEGSPAMANLREQAPQLATDLTPMLTGNRVSGESISRQRWIEAAEAALASNAVTFSVLAVEDVTSDGGLVSKLKSKGYEVSISAE